MAQQVKKYFVCKPPKGAETLVFLAIPATGNCFRRWSLGNFSPNSYIGEDQLPTAPYDLVCFVRDPVERFTAVWASFKRQWKRVERLLDWLENMDAKGVSDGIDTHLRRQVYFETDRAAFMGRWERHQQDWGYLRLQYGLGPYTYPPTLLGTPDWRDSLGDQAARVAEYYMPDFDKFGYDHGPYVRGQSSNAVQGL